MKSFCSACLVMLVFGTIANAQSTFMLSADTVVASVEVPEIVAPGASTVTNQLSSSITVNWTRFIINISPGCMIQVCDPNNCYLPEVSSKNFTLAASGVGNMIVDLVDTSFSGQPVSAIVRLKFTNLAQTSDTASTYYFLSITETTGITPICLSPVTLYPNPVMESFALQSDDTNIRHIRVYNLNGQSVAEYTATPGQRYSLFGQPIGTYFIALADEKGQVLRVLQIVKE